MPTRLIFFYPLYGPWHFHIYISFKLARQHSATCFNSCHDRGEQASNFSRSTPLFHYSRHASTPRRRPLLDPFVPAAHPLILHNHRHTLTRPSIHRRREACLRQWQVRPWLLPNGHQQPPQVVPRHMVQQGSQAMATWLS